MPVQDPTAANTSLWSVYLEDGWARLLDPLGQRYITRAVAAGIAGWLSLAVAPQITWWYGDNAADVSRFLAEHGTPATETVVVPEEYRRIANPSDETPAVEPAAQTQAVSTTAR